MINIILNNVIPCSVNVFSGIYILSKLMQQKINFKSINTYLVFIFLVTVLVLNFYFVNDLVRIIISTISVGFACFFLFHDEIRKTIASTLMEQLVTILSEIIFTILLAIIMNIGDGTLITGYYGQKISAIIISMISLLIININFIKNFCIKVINLVEKLKISYISFMALLFIIVINILLFAMYHEVDLLSIMIINILFVFIYGIIMYNSFLDKNNMQQIQAENKAILNNLEEYEKMLDYQRVSNHENKNQLLIVKSLLKDQNNNQALDYLNEIIEDKKDDNDVLYGKAKKIPSGGLQGIVYQKMLVMSDKEIKPILDVSNSVKKFEFEKIDKKLNYDICRILGVFLDNAIEETAKNKNKEVGLSLYEENNDLIIEVSNQFEKTPDLERIDEKGYSTKGKGHGYGLSLVSEIIKNNDKIINERTITGNVFTQRLVIKGLSKNK